MGYESLERDSLITIREALNLAIKRLTIIGEGDSQWCKDIRYELSRINEKLIS